MKSLPLYIVHLTIVCRFRRSAHVTPKSFLNFIGSYKAVYCKQEDKIGVMAGRMNAGLDKLDEASKAVELLKKELAVMEKNLAVANKKAEEVLVTVTERARESEAVKKNVMQKKRGGRKYSKDYTKRQSCCRICP